MPDTLIDIAKANGVEQVVTEASKATPELTLIPSKPMSGRTIKTLVLVALASTTGSFRDANEGTAAQKHQWENRIFQCYNLEPRIEIDRAVADGHEEGAAKWIEMQARATLEGEFQGVGKQFYYGTGTGGNSKGFPGLMQSYDSTNMVIDAGGTTASTGSSVWAVRFSDEMVRWRWGDGGKFAFDQPMLMPLIDPNDSTKRYMGYHSSFTAYPGLQVNSKQSIARIKKLTADSGKTLTDALLNQLLELFPAGKGPDVIFMTQRSLRQLQSSRTATSPTGAPAPFPTSIQGISGGNIPLAVTESISNAEALTL